MLNLHKNTSVEATPKKIKIFGLKIPTQNGELQQGKKCSQEPYACYAIHLKDMKLRFSSSFESE